MASKPHHVADAHADEHAHPGPAQYIRIAVILAIITAIEVSIFYIDALSSIEAPLLIALSALKFVIVIAYYMHLKFDNRLFTYFFVFGLSIGAAVILSFMALFNRLV